VHREQQRGRQGRTIVEEQPAADLVDEEAGYDVQQDIGEMVPCRPGPPKLVVDDRRCPCNFSGK
jgi:hypothetical protein